MARCAACASACVVAPPSAGDAFICDDVILGLAAEILGRNLLQLYGCRRMLRRARRASWRGLLTPPEGHVHGKFFDVLPQVSSHFSHGTPRSSATTRCTSVQDSGLKIAVTPITGCTSGHPA